MKIHEPLGSRIRAELAALSGLATKYSSAVEAKQRQLLDSRQASYQAQIAATRRTASEHFSSQRDVISNEDRNARQSLLDAISSWNLGALGNPDSRSLTYNPEQVWPVLINLGSMSDAPILAPFIGHQGLKVSGKYYAAQQFIETVFARLVASIPLSSLRVTIFDPQITGLLGGFSGLRAAAQGDAFPVASVDSDELRMRLEFIRSAMVKTSEVLRSTGSTNVVDLDAKTSARPILDILVIDRSQGGIDERTRRVLDQLISSGPKQGVVVMLIDGDQQQSSIDLTDVHFYDNGDVVFEVDGLTLPGVALPPTPYEVQQSLVQEATDAAKGISGPHVPASRILPENLLSESSAEGIEVTIGAHTDGKDLTVALRTQNPPTTNALIAGSIGQGKSNLLLALIYAIAAKYPPAEVEMMLLDLKDGLEFQRFAGTPEGGWLPHASVIGLDSDRRFALSVLDEVVRQKTERSKLFKAAGANNFDAYRNNGNQMPRLVVVIDEFQVLFDNDDDLAKSAVDQLTDIVKTGRASGIHVVLSSQTLSGMQSMATRLDAIFSQVALRMALRNTATESQVVLSQGNKAASALRYRGEVVINNFAGQGEENNIHGMTAFADSEFVQDLQQQLYSKTPSIPRPRVFTAGTFASRPSAEHIASSHTSRTGARKVLLGQAVDVQGTFIWHEFSNDTNQSLAVVGPNREISERILGSIIGSALQRDEYSDIVIVGDSLGKQDFGQSSARITQIPVEQAAEWLRGKPEILLSPRTLMLLPDAQRIPALDYSPPSSQETFSLTSSPSAKDELKSLATSTGEYEADVVFSVQSNNALENILGYSHDGGSGVVGYVFADAPLNDIRQVAGYSAERPLGSPRFAYINVAESTGPTTATPFELGIQE